MIWVSGVSTWMRLIVVLASQNPMWYIDFALFGQSLLAWKGFFMETLCQEQ